MAKNSVPTSPLALVCPWPKKVLLWLLLQFFGHVSERTWQRIGHILATSVIGANIKRARIVQRNIELCFPELTPAQRTDLTQRSLTSQFSAIFELMHRFNNKTNALIVPATIHGLEHFQQALSQQQGIFIVCPHNQHLELGGTVIYQLCQKNNKDFGFIYKHVNYQNDNIILFSRMSNMPNVYPLKSQATREIVSFIRKGGIATIYPDHDLGPKKSLFNRFMGVPTATSPGFAKLCSMSNAICLPASFLKINGKFELTFEPPVQFSDDPMAAANWLNEWVESIVRKAPEQYFWVHKRFKTQPEGCPCPYQEPEKFAAWHHHNPQPNLEDN